jgi:C-terminal processing protease CtpA/Prc
VLSRKTYLLTSERDGASGSARTQTGQRALDLPTILVVNQHTLSDGEDFTEGYRALKLGKIVGEPTAGWVISTSDRSLIDGSIIRLPRLLMADRTGRSLENHPRPVDEEVTRPIGESYTGRDSQLDMAVKKLLAQIGTGFKLPAFLQK